MSEQLLSRMPTLRQRLRLKMYMSNLPTGLRLFPKGIHPDGMSYLLADKPGPPKTRSVRLECTEKLFLMPFCLFLSSVFLPRLDVSYSLGADSSQNLLKGRNRGHGSVPDGCGNGLFYFSSQLFGFFFSPALSYIFQQQKPSKNFVMGRFHSHCEGTYRETEGFNVRQCELMVWIRNSAHYQRCFMCRYMHSKLWMRLSPR